MQTLALSDSQIERLREPIDWQDLDHESPLVTAEKIQRAHQLGVVGVLFTANQVQTRIKELAVLEHTHRNGAVDQTVYAAVMKGGVPFAARFFTEIACLSPNMNPVVDYIQATRYGTGQEGRSELSIVRPLDPKTNFSNKRLVMLDDTIDEGITLELLGKDAQDPERCLELGSGVSGPASELGIITLTDKRIADMPTYPHESIVQGFWIPNVWAGGNGLDGPNEAMRWIPEFVVTRVQHEKYRDTMPRVLDILGERAIFGMNDIHWVSD